MSQLPFLMTTPTETAPQAGESATLHCHLAGGPIEVSVCIVNWNCREVLHACLESLLRRPQGVSLEVIVVDNASGDSAADMVQHNFPDALLIRNRDNYGFARANNQAARLARGRYLFFLNNDTLVPPMTLRRLIEYAETHPEAGIIGPRLRNAEGKLQFSYRHRPTVATLLHRTTLLRWTGMLRHAYHRGRRQDAELDAPRPVEVLMGAAMLVPRPVFQECGPWDEGYTFGGEDMDLCTSVGRRYAVIYLPSVEITHYGRLSTRQHLSYTSVHIPAGFVRFLRKSGCSATALLLYKLMITIDAPVQWLLKKLQYLWRRVLGRRQKAEKSRLAVQSIEHFLHEGLMPFWRA